MFGADTPLVMDALQMAGLALVAGGAAVFFLMRRRKGNPDMRAPDRGSNDLEDRVRVLERIATDQSIGLADEIEALRDSAKQQESAAQ